MSQGERFFSTTSLARRNYLTELFMSFVTAYSRTKEVVTATYTTCIFLLILVFSHIKAMVLLPLLPLQRLCQVSSIAKIVSSIVLAKWSPFIHGCQKEIEHKRVLTCIFVPTSSKHKYYTSHRSTWNRRQNHIRMSKTESWL